MRVHTIGSTVYVTYMLRDTTTYQETLGAGTGIVDAYDVNGNLVKRAITGGNLNAPWGMALAPAGFGTYGGDLLVGNFGDGVINAYNPTTYAFVGQITDANGNPIANPGLWEIVFGQATPSVGDPNTLYFAAGLNQEKDGLFGSIAAVAPTQGAGTFALSASAGSLTVASGQSASTTLSLAPSNGFTGTVSFSCTGLPTGAVCTFSPATVSVTGTTNVQTSLTIATGAGNPTGYMVKAGSPHASKGAGIAVAVVSPFAALLLFGAARRRRFLLLLPLLSLPLIAMAGVTGCGSSKSNTPATMPTPAGTSQVTVTATSGTVSKTATIALTVQ